MSTFARYLMVAACLVAAGCGTKRPAKRKSGTQEPAKAVEAPGAGVDLRKVDIFAEEREVSAREASQDALGTKAVEEPEAEVLEAEKVEALEIEEPKAVDIEM